MKESITIKNFGPINEIEIDDIRPFTVFIGESGSGKSTVIKVIVLFRWMYKMINIRSYLRHANITQSPISLEFKPLLKNNGLSDYLKDDTEIIYKRGNNIISYKSSLESNITIPENDLSLEKLCFIADKRNLIPDILSSKKKNKNEMPMSFYLEETFNDFNIATDFITELNIDYLGVKYFSEKTNSGVKYYIKSINEEEYTINFEDSSSGTQTVTPLAVIIEYFSKHYNFNERFNEIIFKYMAKNDSLKDFRAGLNIGDIHHRNIHLHIEEPELSLYPESQLSLINFIVNRCFINKSEDYNISLMLATHSPYIVNYLNLLILAGKKEQLINNEANLYLHNVEVYEIIDGYLNNLKREESFIIDTSPLSEPIASIYNKYDLLIVKYNG
jgi:predicted ATPase